MGGGANTFLFCLSSEEADEQATRHNAKSRELALLTPQAGFMTLMITTGGIFGSAATIAGAAVPTATILALLVFPRIAGPSQDLLQAGRLGPPGLAEVFVD